MKNQEKRGQPHFGQNDVIYLSFNSFKGSSITLTVTFPIDLREERQQKHLNQKLKV